MAEGSDAFMIYAIGLIKTSRHAFSSMVGSGSRTQDLLGDDRIIFLTSAIVAGSYARCLLRTKSRNQSVNHGLSAVCRTILVGKHISIRLQITVS